MLFNCLKRAYLGRGLGDRGVSGQIAHQKDESKESKQEDDAADDADGDHQLGGVHVLLELITRTQPLQRHVRVVLLLKITTESTVSVWIELYNFSFVRKNQRNEDEQADQFYGQHGTHEDARTFWSAQRSLTDRVSLI